MKVQSNYTNKQKVSFGKVENKLVMDVLSKPVKEAVDAIIREHGSAPDYNLKLFNGINPTPKGNAWVDLEKNNKFITAFCVSNNAGKRGARRFVRLISDYIKNPPVYSDIPKEVIKKDSLFKKFFRF